MFAVVLVTPEGVLKNFAKFPGKHLCQSLTMKKVAGLRLTIEAKFCDGP